MSVSKEKVEEDIKSYENQRDQAKEIFMRAVGSIEALKKLLEEDKKDKK
jgi:hypothetical protein